MFKKKTGRRVQVISTHGQAWRDADDSDDEYEDDYPMPDVSRKRKSTQSGRCMICQTVYKADDEVKKHTCVMCQMKICSRCCSGVDPVCISCVPALTSKGSDKQVAPKFEASKIVFRNPMEVMNKPSKSPDRGPSKSPARGPPPSPLYNKPRSPPKLGRAPPKMAPSLAPPKTAPTLPPPSKPAGFLKTPPTSPPKTSPKNSSVFSVFGRKSPRGDAASPPGKSPPVSPLLPAKGNSSPKLRGLEAELQQLMASTAGRNPTIDERNRIQELMLQVKEEESKNKTSKSAAPTFSLGGNKAKTSVPPAFSPPINKPKWAQKAAPPAKKPSKWNQQPKAVPPEKPSWAQKSKAAPPKKTPGKPSWAQKSKAAPPKTPPTFQPPKKMAPPPKKPSAPMKKFNSAPAPPKKKAESSFLKSILSKTKKQPAKPPKRSTKTFKLGMNKVDQPHRDSMDGTQGKVANNPFLKAQSSPVRKKSPKKPPPKKKTFKKAAKTPPRGPPKAPAAAFKKTGKKGGGIAAMIAARNKLDQEAKSGGY